MAKRRPAKKAARRSARKPAAARKTRARKDRAGKPAAEAGAAEENPPLESLFPSFDPKPSLRFAARALKETGARGALAGRVAVWFWLDDESEHEFTKDVDLAVIRDDMPKVRAWLAASAGRTTELSIGGVNSRHPETGVNVDFIDRTQRGDFSALFAAAVRAARRKGAKAVPVPGRGRVPVVPAEHLVAMKILTGEYRDRRDVERLILRIPDLDLVKTRRLVKQHLGPVGRNLLEVILREVGHPQAERASRYRT